MNDSRLIFDYLRQRKQLHTIVLTSFFVMNFNRATS